MRRGASGRADCAGVNPLYRPSVAAAGLYYIFASPEMASRLRVCGIGTDVDAAGTTDHFPIWPELA